MTSPIYGFPELTPITVERTNTNLVVRYLESLMGAIPTVNVSAVPSSPTDGSVYLINGVPTGIWSGKAGQVGIYTVSGWFYVPTHPKYQYASGTWLLSGGGPAVGGSGRVTMSADRTYYVRATGTRSNSLSTETDATTNTDADAFSTPQEALDAIVQLDCNGNIPTIFIGSGTFPSLTLKSLVGSDQCNITGNGSSNTSIGKVRSYVSQYYQIDSLKISFSSSVAFDVAVDVVGGNVFLGGSCIVRYNNTISPVTHRGSFLTSRKGGTLTLGSGITLTGISSWAIFCTEGSLVIAQSNTLSFVSATISDFTFFTIGLGYTELGGATISGITPTYFKDGGGQIRLPSFIYF
jgi:Protein of unknown function (DUF2793)